MDIIGVFLCKMFLHQKHGSSSRVKSASLIGPRGSQRANRAGDYKPTRFLCAEGRWREFSKMERGPREPRLRLATY